MEVAPTPADSPTGEAALKDLADLYRSTQWVGPLGWLTSSAAIVGALWTRGPNQQLLLIWLAAINIVGIYTALTCVLPALEPRITARRIPSTAAPGYALAGALYGALLWIEPFMRADGEVRMGVLAANFAVTCGAISALSGVHRLAIIELVPLWLVTAAGMYAAGELVVTAGLLVFLVIIVADLERQSGRWRELTQLRIAQAIKAEESDWEARHDPLTGLLNRAGIVEQIDALPRTFAVTGMYVDLDGFKAVNDRFGHNVGDDLLVGVAARMTSAVRAGDLIARIGGDEFFILLNRAVPDERVAQIGRQIIAALEERFELAGDEIFVSCSIGHTTIAGQDLSSERLMIEADQAMYAAKRAGKRQVMSFVQSDSADHQQQVRLESQSRHSK